MPKRIPESVPVPPHVSELLKQWGSVIRAQRLIRQIAMRDFAHRVNVSLNTLQRMERGEQSVQVVNYLTALHLVGVLDKICPIPPVDLAITTRMRVARTVEDDDDYY